MKMQSKLGCGVGLLASVLCAAGCPSDPAVNLGNNTPPARTGATLSDYSGDWSGYAEAYAFSDGTDVVKLSLDAMGNGVIEVGEAEPLPEPDPELGFPPVDMATGPIPLPNILISGFSYPVSDARVASSRIQLATGTPEIYREWCAGMDPVYDEANSLSTGAPVYSCLPNAGFETGDAGCFLLTEPEKTEVDCGKLQCMYVCRCQESGCAVEDGKDVMLDGALEDDGESLVGTLVIGGERITVRLTRD